ncbi:MAG: NAD(P)-binding protein [Candidatus Micrarchaeaceae archaeon]
METKQMSNHVIICGGGIVGQKIAAMLFESNIPFIIIEINEKVAEKMRLAGYSVIVGDATLSVNLKQAFISTAKAIAIVMDNDAKNLFAVLTARDLNKKIFIATRANDEFMREKLIEAKADYVIMPQKTASSEILKELGIT